VVVANAVLIGPTPQAFAGVVLLPNRPTKLRYAKTCLTRPLGRRFDGLRFVHTACAQVCLLAVHNQRVNPFALCQECLRNVEDQPVLGMVEDVAAVLKEHERIIVRVVRDQQLLVLAVVPARAFKTAMDCSTVDRIQGAAQRILRQPSEAKFFEYVHSCVVVCDRMRAHGRRRRVDCILDDYSQAWLRWHAMRLGDVNWSTRFVACFFLGTFLRFRASLASAARTLGCPA